MLEVVDELLLVTGEGLDLRSTEDLGSTNSLVLDGRETSSKDGFSDQSDGHSEIESIDSGPLSGTLLRSGIGDLGDHSFTVVILEFEDFGGDLNEVRIEDTSVPLLEDGGDLVLSHVESTTQDVVSLSNLDQYASKSAKRE